MNAALHAMNADLTEDLQSLRFRPTPQQFGAVENDGQDDTASILAAIESAPNLRFPSGVYDITSALPVPTGATWEFEGVILRATGTHAIVASNTRDWTISGALKVETQKIGLLIENPRGARIERLSVQGADTGVIVQGAAQSLPRADTLSIGDLRLSGNGVGLQVDAGAGAEFVTIQHIDAIGNGLAASIRAGNVKILGGNVVDNGDGLLFVGGHNHGHGILSGTTIAHNAGFNLRFEGVTNGYIVAANAIYGDGADAGLIEIDGSEGIVISGGILAARVIESRPVRAAIICDNHRIFPARLATAC